MTIRKIIRKKIRCPHTGTHGLINSAEGIAKECLGQKPVAAPQTDARRLAYARRFRRNVTSGISPANYQHTLSYQLGRCPVILGVHELACKFSRILRKTPVPVVPVANNLPFVDALFAAREFELPASIRKR